MNARSLRKLRSRGIRGFLSGVLLLSAPSLLSAAGVTRTYLPDHRLGPIQVGRTTEKEAVERLGEGLRFPTARGSGRCWSEEHLMLCAAFVNGKVIAVSIEKGGALPAAATRFLRGPEGKKAAPSPGALQAILKPGLFLSNLATETGLRIDSTERDVLAALGSPQELPSAQPPFRFIYRSSRENDPACPGRCSGTYTLKSEHLMAIFLQAE